MGALSVPREIGIKGAEKFKGPVFHSARWDHSVNVKGKNVVVIGNGCSATQIVPQIAPLVKQLTQVVSVSVCSSSATNCKLKCAIA